MSTQTAEALLANYLESWKALLTQWSSDGSLSAAAQEVLLLDEEPPALTDLITQWSAGDYRQLPPIVLLSNADIGGAMGAYALSTETIYINQDWLLSASQAQVEAVLTEELGHHLDGLLNEVDTPGDEGEYFSQSLSTNYVYYDATRSIGIRSDIGEIKVAGNAVGVEFAASVLLRGNSLYKILDQATWQTSENRAMALGGHLTRVNDASENQYLTNFSSGYIPGPAFESSYLWTGGMFKNTGEIYWDNFAIVSNSYTNWVSGGTPSTRFEGYRPVVIDKDGKWWTTDSTNTLQGIAEIPVKLEIFYSSAPTEGAGAFETHIALSSGTELSGNLVEGSQLFWRISGIEINDLAAGSLMGSGIVTGGKLVISHSLNADPDSGENFEVSVYSDPEMNIAVGEMSSISILEGNRAPFLDTSYSPTLGFVLEGDPNPVGMSVAQMVVDGSITDPDGPAVEAIAIEAVETSLGTAESLCVV